MAFEPGDVVELKSGSPLLTVQSATETTVTCVWYEESLGEFRTHDFAPVLLDEVIVVEEGDFDDEDEDEDEEEGEDDARN